MEDLVASELKGGDWKSGKGLFMRESNIIQITRYRETTNKKRQVEPLNAGKKGRVYNRRGILWVDFHYLGQRVRESSGLKDTPDNQRKVRGQLDLVVSEIENGVFEFAKRFPYSSKKEHFTALEGKNVIIDPEDVLFGEYVKRWWIEMEPGMTSSQIRDYRSILDFHHIPYFADLPFSEFNPVLMKKFLAHLKSKKASSNKPLSAKRIQNVMIPLRMIVRDAIIEYGWSDFVDPFIGLKLPKVPKTRVSPFSFKEWKILMGFIPQWYKPYFEFSVQTGLRPSEQVAIKWRAVDHEYVHIELSRVRNQEKGELKTEESRRSIAIRPAMAKVLEDQKKLTADFQSPYVFLNTKGRPILQDKLRELWVRVMKKSGLRYRRMYETRHTFASWALDAGETPEWVALTLGHVNTSMVYKTYGRYIPNLTRKDGSAFEKRFCEEIK
jgi:integrase